MKIKKITDVILNLTTSLIIKTVIPLYVLRSSFTDFELNMNNFSPRI